MRKLVHANSPVDLSRTVLVTPYSNSPMFAVRPELYESFARMIRPISEATGLKFVTAEIAFGQREFQVTGDLIVAEGENELHVQFRSHEELWHKENICVEAVQHAVRVWPDIDKIMIVDGDCWPVAIPPQVWLEKTWHQLEHFEIVQMWKYLINFGPDGQPITKPQLSFMATYELAGFDVPETRNVKHTLAGHSGVISLGRPGLAWAFNRFSAWDRIGGLLDKCILGSGDWHGAHCYVQAAKRGTYEASKCSEYEQYILHYQTLCERWIKKDVGYVDVTLGHGFHGLKEGNPLLGPGRQYGDRGQVLIRNKYNPMKDIKRDSQGLWQLETHEPRQIRLRDEIRHYFKTRNEDSVAFRNQIPRGIL
jgi:hypothetical protein